MHGLYTKTPAELLSIYNRAMDAKAYGVAERVAAYMNEGRTTYVPPPGTGMREVPDDAACILCAGECRGHSLGHPEEWVPEPGSLAAQAAAAA